MNFKSAYCTTESTDARRQRRIPGAQSRQVIAGDYYFYLSELDPRNTLFVVPLSQMFAATGGYRVLNLAQVIR